MTRPDRPAVQSLEARRLMAAAPLTLTQASYGSGTMLKIAGTVANDTITLTYDGTAYTVATAAGFTKTVVGPFAAIKISGNKGNDKITVDAAVTTPVCLLGEDGNDTLTGGSGDDTLVGGLGTNWLYGQAGRDTLVSLGGAANDGLTGGAGDDFFWADNKATEKVYDANSFETAHTLNRVSAFETSKFATGSVKTQAVTTAIAGQKFADPTATGKSFVYKAFTDRPLFSASGPTADDVKQGQVGDCYFLSTLAATANAAPETVRDMVSDLGDGTYAVKFKNASGQAKFYRVDNDLAAYSNSPTTPAYAALGVGNSMWVAVAEKAWAYARKNQGSYGSISGGWMTEALTAVGATNAQQLWKDNSTTADAYLDWVRARLDEGDVVTLGIFTSNDKLNLVGGHAYSVIGVTTAADGTRQLVIRNPWGVDAYRTDDGANDGFLTLSATNALAGIDAFVAAKAA